MPINPRTSSQGPFAGASYHKVQLKERVTPAAFDRILEGGVWPRLVVGGLAMSKFDAILKSVSQLGTLGDVMTWARTFEPPAEFIDVVGLDEFTNDVIIRVKPDLFAVFDTT